MARDRDSWGFCACVARMGACSKPHETLAAARKPISPRGGATHGTAAPARCSGRIKPTCRPIPAATQPRKPKNAWVWSSGAIRQALPAIVHAPGPAPPDPPPACPPCRRLLPAASL